MTQEEANRKFIDLIIALAYEIRDLKENECQNSGLSWMEDFRKELPIFEEYLIPKKDE